MNGAPRAGPRGRGAGGGCRVDGHRGRRAKPLPGPGPSAFRPPRSPAPACPGPTAPVPQGPWSPAPGSRGSGVRAPVLSRSPSPKRRALLRAAAPPLRRSLGPPLRRSLRAVTPAPSGPSTLGPRRPPSPPHSPTPAPLGPAAPRPAGPPLRPRAVVVAGAAMVAGTAARRGVPGPDGAVPVPGRPLPGAGVPVCSKWCPLLSDGPSSSWRGCLTCRKRYASQRAGGRCRVCSFVAASLRK
ncbi:conserved protein of unknown function [Streptomyces murinus]